MPPALPHTSPPLVLPGDRQGDHPDIAAHLAAWADGDAVRMALAVLMRAIADAAVPLARRLAAGGLPGDPAALVGVNDSGDRQKALDVGAHDHMIAALRHASVHAVLSEEAEAVVPMDPAGAFDVAIDPIDGSDSIGIGAPLGLLFAVFPAGSTFLRPGREVIAAGYISFGHSVDIGFSTGSGLAMATLGADGTFRVTDKAVRLPDATANYAVNASNQRHWGLGLQRYVADLMAGRDGPRAKDFNMRWMGAAVADMHRILRRGGVFLYPGDARKGYETGRLRLIYEAFVMAYIVEQAGGMATDGEGPILDRTPTGLHQTTPLIFGSHAEVETLMTYLHP